MAKVTDTFHIIQYRDVPAYRLKDVTYTKVFCKLKHNKEDKNRMRIIAGGNQIIYPGDVGKKLDPSRQSSWSPTASSLIPALDFPYFT